MVVYVWWYGWRVVCFTETGHNHIRAFLYPDVGLFVIAEVLLLIARLYPGSICQNCYHDSTQR